MARRIRVINIPRTRTLLAVGVLAGAFTLGAGVDWGALLFLVLGAYFGRIGGPASGASR